MKYFYISLFLSISFLVIGTAVSIEQKHSAAKAQAELLKAQELQEDDAPEAELTFEKNAYKPFAHSLPAWP